MEDLHGSAGKLADMLSTGLKIATAAGVAGLLAFGKSAVDSANENARAQAQLQAVLTSTNYAAGIAKSTLNDWAAALQNSTTYSDEAVNGVQSLLLTFTNIKNDVFPQTTQVVLDMATALGEDLKSASIQVGKALQEPITGVTALRRVGVQLNDDQAKLIKTLVESGRGMEAQKIILAELTKEFGGSAAAAADTFAGKLAQLNNKFDDMKEVVGRAIINALLPSLTKLGDWFTAHQTDIENFFVDGVAKAQDAIDQFAKGMDTIKDGLQLIIDNVPGAKTAMIGLAAAIAIEFGPAGAAYAALAGIILLVGQLRGGLLSGDLPSGGHFVNQSDLERFKQKQMQDQNPAMFGPGGSTGLGLPGPFAPGSNDVQAELDYRKAQEQAAAAAKETAQQFSGAAGAAAKVKTVLEQLSDAFSKLLGAPTRELANKQLQQANLELQLAQKEAAGTARLDDLKRRLAGEEAKGVKDSQLTALKNQIEEASGTKLKQQIETVGKSIQVETSKTKVLEAQMTAANQGLLTDKERDKVARALIEQEKGATSSIKTFGEKIQALFPDLKEFGAQLRNAILAPTVEGSHAGGLAYVPHDNYIARLHRGERVLTAAEASGGSGDRQPIILQIDGREIGRVIVDLVGGGGLRGVVAA